MLLERKLWSDRTQSFFFEAPHTKLAPCQMQTLAREQRTELSLATSAPDSLLAGNGVGQAACTDGAYCPVSVRDCTLVLGWC